MAWIGTLLINFCLLAGPFKPKLKPKLFTRVPAGHVMVAGGMDLHSCFCL